MQAGFEVQEASGPQCLSQPWGSQGSAAGIAPKAELGAPLHPFGLPALQPWLLQERKSLNKRHTLKYPSGERHSAAQEASMYWSENQITQGGDSPNNYSVFVVERETFARKWLKSIGTGSKGIMTGPKWLCTQASYFSTPFHWSKAEDKEKKKKGKTPSLFT